MPNTDPSLTHTVTTREAGEGHWLREREAAANHAAATMRKCHQHIADGDFVVIKKQTQAHPGQIVAVHDEDGAFTLRKFYRETNGSIRLESGGGRSSVVRPADFLILGVLVGVVRKY